MIGFVEWRPRRAGVVAIVAIALIALTVPQSLTAAGESSIEDRLSEAIPQRMARDDVPGLVVALLREGVPVWTRAFGMADPGEGRAMRPDALFRVESISKPVTAWGAMRLAEAGELDLDAPVTECLTDWTPPGGLPRITPRQLLSNTAGIGLGDYTERYAPGAWRPTLADYLADDFTIIGPSGGGFAYSDTGFNLMELVVEACTGRDFAAYMDGAVFAPMGMEQASFDWTGADMPVGHDLSGQPVAPYVYPGTASGGLHATVTDLARFAAAEMSGDGDILSTDALEEMHRSEIVVGGLFGFAADGYGLGHFTETLSDGRHSVWHGGQGYGWMSHVHMVPEGGDAIIILSNSQRAWPLFAMILKDWSESLGVAPVGMSRVLWVERAARVAIVLTAIVFLVFLGASFDRPRSAGGMRVFAGIFAVGLMAWPIWAMFQDYSFLFSILPGLWVWLAASSAIAGLGLLFFAFGLGRWGTSNGA